MSDQTPMERILAIACSERISRQLDEAKRAIDQNKAEPDYPDYLDGHDDMSIGPYTVLKDDPEGDLDQLRRMIADHETLLAEQRGTQFGRGASSEPAPKEQATLRRKFSDGALADRPEAKGPQPPESPEGPQNPSADYENWTCGTDHLAAERTIRLIKRTGTDSLDAMENLAQLVIRAGPAAARQALSWEDDVPF